MSVQLLRDGAIADLKAQIEEKQGLLSNCVTHDLGQLRLLQGMVQGLKTAIELIEDRAGNLHPGGAPWR